MLENSQFTEKADLGSLKWEIGKLDFEKLADSDADMLKDVPCKFKKLSVIVDKKVKKYVYDELAKKTDAIDTSELIEKQW